MGNLIIKLKSVIFDKNIQILNLEILHSSKTRYYLNWKNIEALKRKY